MKRQQIKNNKTQQISKIYASISKQVVQKLIKLFEQLNKEDLPNQLTDPKFDNCLKIQIDRISLVREQSQLQIASNNVLTLSVIRGICQVIKRIRNVQKSNKVYHIQRRVCKSQGSKKIKTVNDQSQLKSFLFEQMNQIKPIVQLLKNDSFSDALIQTKKVSTNFINSGSSEAAVLLLNFVYEPVVQGLVQRANQLKQMLETSIFVENKIQRIKSLDILQESILHDQQIVMSQKDYFTTSLQMNNHKNCKGTEQNSFEGKILEQDSQFGRSKQCQDNEKRLQQSIKRSFKTKANYYQQSRNETDKLFNSIRHRIDQVSSLSQKMTKIKQNLKNRPKQLQNRRSAFNKTFDC